MSRYTGYLSLLPSGRLYLSLCLYKLRQDDVTRPTVFPSVLLFVLSVQMHLSTVRTRCTSDDLESYSGVGERSPGV